jgi:NAD(P)-dependent dehydrogenase (short-subunit alcohol dehydrogenase family)
MRLANKSVVITGGNSGIGLATARLFLAEGAKVGITGRNEKTLREAAETLGAGVVALRADATDLSATERAFAQFAERLGKLDGVFVNAGIGGQTALGQTTVAAFEEIVRSNFTAAFFTVQAALPHLRDGASIVFNGSVHAVLGMPGYSAYAGSKAAVRAMVRNLASELAPRGIRVNQVTPGATRTPIWASLVGDAMAALEKRIAAVTPLGGMGEADDIAKAALYLVSDDAAHVTATELVVDGGAINAPSGAPLFRVA